MSDNMYPMYPVSDNEREQLANMLRSYAEASRNISPLVGLQLPPHVAEKFLRAADLLEAQYEYDTTPELQELLERASTSETVIRTDLLDGDQLDNI